MKCGDIEVSIDDALAEAGVTIACVLMTGLANRFTRSGFGAMRATLIRDILARETLAAVVATPNLRGYRELHARCEGTDAVPSPESLFAALFQHGELRDINPIVDVYNTVALKHRISCGAHDAATLAGAVHLRFTGGGERFRALGRSRDVILSAGDYAYVDGADRVICRRECRQGGHSAVTETTRDVLFVVQGNARIAPAAVAAAAADIADLVARHIARPRAVHHALVPAPSASGDTRVVA